MIVEGPGCSNSHIPGFMNHARIKDAGNVFVVTVNDAFVYVFRRVYLRSI